MSATVKMVGVSGQIYLGKEYAGKLVMLDEVEPGVWLLKSGAFVPDNERWLHEPGMKETLDRAIAWAESNPPAESDIDALIEQLGA